MVKQGGAMWNGQNLYVGRTERVPRRFVRRATVNEAFKIGRKIGYYAGSFINKKFVIENHPKIGAKVLAFMARKLGCKYYQDMKKAELVDFLTRHNWTRISIKEFLV
jgi:hypothetical protein